MHTGPSLCPQPGGGFELPPGGVQVRGETPHGLMVVLVVVLVVVVKYHSHAPERAHSSMSI